MRLHLDALILLHRVWGAFGVLTGTSVALLALGTQAALHQLTAVGRPEHAAVGLLVVCAALLTGVGLGALFAARGLRHRQTFGRAAALVLAIPNLIVVPFGTALGVYTIWVLLNNDARREFGRPARGSSTRTHHEAPKVMEQE